MVNICNRVYYRFIIMTVKLVLIQARNEQAGKICDMRGYLPQCSGFFVRFPRESVVSEPHARLCPN